MGKALLLCLWAFLLKKTRPLLRTCFQMVEARGVIQENLVPLYALKTR